MSQIQHQFKPASRILQFSERDRAFMKNPKQFEAFMSYENSIDAFRKACSDKKANYNATMRTLMADVVEEQADRLKLKHEASLANIKALRSENTFAIITAHQPCLMSGPLYFIYKIASAVSLARKLNEVYSDLNFVPLYVPGSEDHDFEEINHLKLFGNRLEWTSDAKGAVGRMKLDGIDQVVDQIEELLGHAAFKDNIIDILRSSYSEDRTLAEATAHFVYSIFGGYGIVVADLDDKRFKEAAKPLFEAELLNQIAFDKTIENQERLQELGYEAQVYVRPINLFFLGDKSRTKIDLIKENYLIDNEEINIDSIKQYIHEKVHHFSPNVILRPLYQQMILPGVAYIGGGAEVAYWMEIRGVFDAQNLTFPMLLRRDSAMWIKPHTMGLMEKTGLTQEQLFLTQHEAQTEILKSKVDHDWSLESTRSVLGEVFLNINRDVEQVDQGLLGMIKGFEAQQANFIDKLETKMKRSLKSQHEVSMNRIEKIWDDLFPDNSLQERKSNFLAIYSRIGPRLISTLIDHFDPLNPGMHIFVESAD